MRRPCRTPSGPAPGPFLDPSCATPFLEQRRGVAQARMPDRSGEESLGREFRLRGELVEPGRRLHAEGGPERLSSVDGGCDEEDGELLDVRERKVAGDVHAL